MRIYVAHIHYASLDCTYAFCQRTLKLMFLAQEAKAADRRRPTQGLGGAEKGIEIRDSPVGRTISAIATPFHPWKTCTHEYTHVQLDSWASSF